MAISSTPIVEVSASSPDIQPLMALFRSATSTPRSMQNTIHALTHHVASAAQSHDPSLSTHSTTLIPILRGALPMLVAAQPLFPSTSCLLARCSKKKGTGDVIVEWLGRKPYPAGPDDDDDDGRLIILDTIIATGDTILHLCNEIQRLSKQNGHNADKSIVVLCCYAAPDALDRIANHPLVELIVVAQRAERCDDAGYLVPYTNGDIGDKIFGSAGHEEVQQQPVIAEGQDEAAVRAGVEALLTRNGGLWQLTADGRGIEREIRFKTFSRTWAFMQRIADEAAKHRHHPEWTNVYNKVSVRWTTHQPQGLTELDVTLARLCDEYSRP
ncbi:4-alpha-hydroxytetrahydrobiopterin dehydratase [Emydomyces testavorans]|uniref:4a-hydroxytetrahydrobiopterin dehydratase n=1 Tax=Emydomyces testavorans TaxID=2070801 RepID=A0AAF0DJ91_9EURO|nr:4-alpha-hydroxytetrahydrobiopterin dehydratase [Emydomyces testavorans]